MAESKTADVCKRGAFFHNTVEFSVSLCPTSLVERTVGNAFYYLLTPM